MKVYKIKVNGKIYEVEVEVYEKEGIIKEDKEQNIDNHVTSNINVQGEKVRSPIQGSVLSIKVNKGDKVKKGDVLLILEAMKMENEILSNVTGVVDEIYVSEGKSVNSQDVLLVIR